MNNVGSKIQKKVHFSKKSEWQYGDCYFGEQANCLNVSTHEAVCGEGRVRCCTDRRCMERAARLARSIAEFWDTAMTPGLNEKK